MRFWQARAQRAADDRPKRKRHALAAQDKSVLVRVVHVAEIRDDRGAAAAGPLGDEILRDVSASGEQSAGK